MQRPGKHLIWLVGLALGSVLVGCNLSVDEPENESTALPVSSPTAIPAPTLISPAFATLEPFTGPYGDATPLISGVCFEYLYTLDDTTWVWSTAGELAAFYDAVDASELCGEPVTRWPFDFSGQVLAGAVNTGVGCDAAHRYIDLVTDEAAQRLRLRLEFALLPGCEYEIAQPFLIAMPRPPNGYGLDVIVSDAESG